MANPQRLRKVADQIQRELSQIVRSELKDPRVGMITFTGVEVSSDLAHAKVFYTLLGDSDQKEHTNKGLKRAAGFIRTMLGQKLSTHTTPELHFIYDESVERGVRLSRLIDEAVAGIPEKTAE